MDTRTLEYYGLNAAEIAVRYDRVASPIAELITPNFPRGARLLDIGTGSGRDLAVFVARGYDAFGVEPVGAFRTYAEKQYPQLRRRITRGGLPHLAKPFGGGFNGVTCSAVLMHVPASDLDASALAIRGVLKRQGRLMISVPLSRLDVGTDQRDADGRLMVTHTPEVLSALFKGLGFSQMGRWTHADPLQRKGFQTVTLLFELQDGHVSATSA